MGIMKLPIKQELQGVMAAITSFYTFDTPARVGMAIHHVQQACTVKRPEINRIMTGMDAQLISYGTSMPVNGVIISVHKKYRQGLDIYSNRENPLITIIYRNQENGEYDCLDIETYHSKHRIFGSKNVVNPIVYRLTPGMCIDKDTWFTKSPNVHEGGIYSNGLMTNVAIMSHPATIEDGFLASESYCERAGLLQLPIISASWGKTRYPLNLYGNDDEYKIFPDIGDKVREDGLVLALREYNPLYDSTTMTNKALQTVDYEHDIRFYSIPNATVYDITVESGIGESKQKPITPSIMAVQPERYISSTRDYYNSILESYNRNICVTKTPTLSPRVINLVCRALADQPNIHKTAGKNNSRIRRVYKKSPIDEYNVTIRMKSDFNLAKGSKITNLHGAKGVICAIVPDEDMPVDKDGNRADIVKDARSEAARVNPGQKYDQFINAASRDLSKWIVNEYKQHSFTTVPDYIWDKLVEYYKATSTTNYSYVLNLTEEGKNKHIASVLESGIYLVIHTADSTLNKDIYHRIRKVIKPVEDVVSYVNFLGKRITTKDKIFIGVEYFIVLEKSHIVPMSVSSSPSQHHGLLPGPNKAARTGHPGKVQATKVYSESEGRLYPSIQGAKAAGDEFTYNNSPEMHKLVVEGLYSTITPSRLDLNINVDRRTSRPHKYIFSTLTGFGLQLVKGNRVDKGSNLVNNVWQPKIRFKDKIFRSIKKNFKEKVGLVVNYLKGN